MPNAVFNDILTHNDPDGKRGKWIDVILEYDVEIKPTTLQGKDPLADVFEEPQRKIPHTFVSSRGY